MRGDRSAVHVRVDEQAGATGHAQGDDLLRRIGRVLREDARPRLPARIGGDEFLVLVLLGLRPAERRRPTRCGSPHTSIARAAYDVGGRAVTVSIGTSTFSEDGADFDALLHVAHRRMYVIKNRAEPA